MLILKKLNTTKIAPKKALASIIRTFIVKALQTFSTVLLNLFSFAAHF